MQSIRGRLQILSNLTSVDIPSSVTSIEGGAFSYCPNLAEVLIPDSVTNLDDATFQFSGLKDVTIPSSITSIGRDEFFGCSNLTSVTFNGSVTNIGDGAFQYCNLVNLSLPNTLKTIGVAAFEGSSNLSQVTFPSSVTSIGFGAFYSDTSLTYACFKGAPPADGGYIFSGCPLTVVFYVAGTFGWGTHYDGIPTSSCTLCGYGPGSLQVTILPPEAVSAGAQWTVSGDGPWRNSGAVVGNLSAGIHLVQFSDISGWQTPLDEYIVIVSGQQTNITGIYTETNGSLQVFLTPVEVTTNGAQWTIDSTNWYDSAFTLTNLPQGNYTIQFKNVFGWTTPSNQTVTINGGQSTTATGNYTGGDGFLQVGILPSAAVTAGAQWSLDGVDWLNSGATMNLPAGNYTVLFSDIIGWNTPLDEFVVISPGQTTTATGLYILETGSLQVFILPGGALSAGAQWQVDGGAWQNSAATVANLSLGNHTVIFKLINGWTTPAIQTVAISANALTATTGIYVSISQSGSLQVTLNPAGAVSGGAQWEVDGGAWQNSGITIGSLAINNHTVLFKTISGWTAPANQTIAVVANATAATSGTYSTNAQIGSLQVNLGPVGAVAAGAQWQVDGGAWQKSGAVIGGLAVGAHTVSYTTLSAWTPPAVQIVSIIANTTTTTVGNYVATTYGSLLVVLSPAAAVSAGAAWQVDGGSWQTNGATVKALVTGNHSVGFNIVGGWQSPAVLTVAVNSNLTTVTNGIYVAAILPPPAPVLALINSQPVLLCASNDNQS